MDSRDRALIVADNPTERHAFCADLDRAGYDPVAFESCRVALTWLEEETPAVAVVRTSSEGLCGVLLDELLARCVELVVDGEPVDALGC